MIDPDKYDRVLKFYKELKRCYEADYSRRRAIAQKMGINLNPTFEEVSRYTVNTLIEEAQICLN